MGSIALKYGVDLQDLLAANPATDPHFLTIGKILIIPIKGNGQDPGALYTLTPIPVGQTKPYCYRSSNGGCWCFLRIDNNQEQALENLSARITLFSPSGEPITSQTAFAPLNLLLAGMSLPLAAYFAADVPVEFTVRADLLTDLLVGKDDSRYLQAMVKLEKTTISQDGSQATVKGKVILSNNQLPAKVIWLAVVAYDVDGDVVGMRRFELDQQSFNVDVFSLGPSIHRVDAQVEARP